MSRETLFAYLAAFVTIVLALALTDLLQSLHRLIRARARVRWAALPLIAAFYVYLTVLSEFFSLWFSLRLDHIAFLGLVAQMAVPTSIAMMAFASLPDDVPADGLDLAEFYERDRWYFLAVLTAGMVADLARNIAIAFTAPGGPSAHYGIFLIGTFGIQFVAAGLLWSGAARWRQYLGWALLFAVAAYGYVGAALRAT